MLQLALICCLLCMRLRLCAAMGFGAVHCVMRPSGELAEQLLL
jgi:hypothetical protein